MRTSNSKNLGTTNYLKMSLRLVTHLTLLPNMTSIPRLRWVTDRFSLAKKRKEGVGLVGVHNL